MNEFVWISIGCFMMGLVVGALSASLAVRVEHMAVFVCMLILSPVLVIAGLFLSEVLDNRIIFYVSVFVSGILIFVPGLLLLNLYLLWWNPAKYKEYSMKKRKREREVAKRAENGSGG
jgi:hypothetical protein